MLRKTRTRRWLLNALIALLVVSATLWTSAAVMAQSSARFSLGCWAVSSGGGDQRASTAFRTRDTIKYTGGEMQSPTFRIRANHFALLPVLNPVGTVAPVPDPGSVFLPIGRGEGLNLQNICD